MSSISTKSTIFKQFQLHCQTLLCGHNLTKLITPRTCSKGATELQNESGARNFSCESYKKLEQTNGQKKHLAHIADYRSRLQSDQYCQPSFNEH